MSKPANHPTQQIFTVQDAAAQGYSRAQATRKGLHRVASQVYAHDTYQPKYNELLQLVHKTAPEAVIGSVSAAKLLGMRMPSRLREESIIHLLQGSAATRIRRKGIRCSRAVLKEDEITSLDGVRCTTYSRTFFDLAQILSHRELIGVADGLLVFHRHRPGQHIPIITREELTHYLQRHTGKRGIARCYQALEEPVTGSDSYMETVLRMILQDAGIRNLQCNVPVYDDNGNLLFQPDLALLGNKLSIQYEGEHHGGREQIRRDINRARAVASVGWREIRIFVDDIYQKVWHRGEYLPRAAALVLQALEQ